MSKSVSMYDNKGIFMKIEIQNQLKPSDIEIPMQKKVATEKNNTK